MNTTLLGPWVLTNSPQTLNSTSLSILTALACIALISSCGQLLIMLAGGIDLSVSAVITLVAAATVKLSGGSAWQLPALILSALALALLVGLINGGLVTYASLNPVIVTLAMQGIVTAATLIWAGVSFSSSGQAPPGLVRFSGQAWGPVSVLAVLALLLVICLAFLLRRTLAGRRYVAIGANQRAARILGIRTRSGILADYGLAGLFYGIAGVLLAGFLKTPGLTVGAPYQLSTIVAVALSGAILTGGSASLTALTASVFFLALLDQYLAVKGLSGGMQLIVQGIVLVVAVALLSTAGNRRRFTSTVRKLAVRSPR